MAASKWISERRAVCGYTQEALAKRAGVAVRTLIAWEGGYHTPTLVNQHDLAIALDMDPRLVRRLFDDAKKWKGQADPHQPRRVRPLRRCRQQGHRLCVVRRGVAQ